MIYTIAGKLKSIIPGFMFNALVNVYKKAESSYTHFRLPFKIKRAEKYHAIAIEELKKKKKIKVAFFVIHDSVWKYKHLYELMLKDEKFEPHVFVCPYISFGEDIMKSTLNRTFEYFVKNKYEVSKTLLEDETWLNIKGEFNPDIVFFTNPHPLTKEEYYINHFEDKLTAYVQYSFHVSHLNKLQYDQPFHNLIWKQFCETPLHVEFAKENATNKGVNAIHTGYAGTDYFLMKKRNTENKKIKIIWAPHHTIQKINAEIEYSNFLSLFEFIPNLIYQYPVEICFKPHPILKHRLENHKEWGKLKTEEYYKRWETTDNLSINESDYEDLFIESDALIHDSGSFLAEYLYMNKPCLFCIKNDSVPNQFNKFGKIAMSAHYLSNKKEDIINFIEKVLIEGNDRLKSKREEVIKNYLIPPNEKTASNNILEYIKSYTE